MNLEIIRKLAKNRAGGLRKLASDIGMSEANLHRRINDNRIQASDLENIAKLLNVDIRIFFDDNPAVCSPDSDNLDQLKEFINLLKGRIEKLEAVFNGEQSNIG